MFVISRLLRETNRAQIRMTKTRAASREKGLPAKKDPEEEVDDTIEVSF